MEEKVVSEGLVHQLPDWIRDAILSSSDLYNFWEDITPLARNEWICWITSAKKDATQAKRLRIMCSNLLEGKRRPCCWPGCPHRTKKSTK